MAALSGCATGCCLQAWRASLAAPVHYRAFWVLVSREYHKNLALDKLSQAQAQECQKPGQAACTDRAAPATVEEASRSPPLRGKRTTGKTGVAGFSGLLEKLLAVRCCQRVTADESTSGKGRPWMKHQQRSHGDSSFLR
eukprot:TRINITY_DN6503_c0_g1_i4.p1 TRINITY_DN6503_c0_g1~~TRINITY_DN6503_c0_g1_i4.p1  ORF type:complete len:139 (+),score=29.34 TRINITY_DN6503_c0_g1_i4:89-505(+)